MFGVLHLARPYQVDAETQNRVLVRIRVGHSQPGIKKQSKDILHGEFGGVACGVSIASCWRLYVGADHELATDTLHYFRAHLHCVETKE